MKTHITSNGKQIKVWDGVIDYATAAFFFEYAQNSLYKIGWSDGYSEGQRRYKYLHSSLSIEESMHSKILPTVLSSEIAEHIENTSLKKAIINLSTPSDVHYPHTHPEKYALLYYANPIWQAQWYGETLFFNESASEIELALPYTPHRLVLFEAGIPHSIRPQSRDCESHRFTYAMMFD